MAVSASAEGSTVNVRRGAAIAWGSALALLVFVAAFDNQWTRNWRDRQGRFGVPNDYFGSNAQSGVHSWTGTPIADLSVLDWRVSPRSGTPSRVFGGSLAAAILSVLLTGLLIWILCRGLSSTRGRWTLFVGVWFSVAAATAVSLIVGMVVAFAGKADSPLGSGTTYYLLIGEGMGFALFIGWLIGLIAVLLYNISGGMDDLAFNSSYQPSAGYDYGMAGLAADYGIGPTRTAPSSQSSYYPPASSSSDPGESPTTPLGPFGRS